MCDFLQVGLGPLPFVGFPASTQPAKIKEALRSISSYEIDRSTLSLDSEALEGQNTKILAHFSSFLILAHFL